MGALIRLAKVLELKLGKEIDLQDMVYETVCLIHNEIVQDQTTMYVINNLANLGYDSACIINLFISTISSEVSYEQVHQITIDDDCKIESLQIKLNHEILEELKIGTRDLSTDESLALFLF